jgi:hypothetical protein
LNKKTLALVSISLGFWGLTTRQALADGPFQFYSVTPCRIVDTRNPAGATGGPELASGAVRNFPVSGGPCGVPAGAKAATVNVTMVSPTTAGFLTIWPYGSTKPKVSTINAAGGEAAIANGAIVPLSSDPSFGISIVYGTAHPGSCHVLIDVTGYFQ